MNGLQTHPGVQQGQSFSTFSARNHFDSGAQRPHRRQVNSCRASARQPNGADGGSAADPPGETSIDIEWRQRRWGNLWESLAEQDRSWAVHSYTETDDHCNFGSSALDDSWDLGSNTNCSPATSLAHAPWPTYGSSAGQESLLLNQRTVYVILFGVGSSDTEGIYSVRVITREEGLPQDTIVAFSAEEDAARYAGLLEASMEHSPTVIGLEPSELVDFCKDSNYSYRVEADGSLLIPPDYYVGITDWERSIRLREGRWSVSERDFITAQGNEPDTSIAKDMQRPLVGNNANNYLPSDASYVLEEQRARLERLAARE